MLDRSAQSYCIEPFDSVRHDRDGFSCGIAAIDNYFHKTANKLAKADNIRLYVMVAPEGAVMGFYAINAHAVSYEALPPRSDRAEVAGRGMIDVFCLSSDEAGQAVALMQGTVYRKQEASVSLSPRRYRKARNGLAPHGFLCRCSEATHPHNVGTRKRPGSSARC
jgi:hypothetical protein